MLNQAGCTHEQAPQVTKYLIEIWVYNRTGLPLETLEFGNYSESGYFKENGEFSHEFLSQTVDCEEGENDFRFAVSYTEPTFFLRFRFQNGQTTVQYFDLAGFEDETHPQKKEITLEQIQGRFQITQTDST